MSDEMLEKTIELTGKMVELADLGDEARNDTGCGVLYGLLRDSAYKIRRAAEQEKEDHLRRQTCGRMKRNSSAEKGWGKLEED